MSSQVYGVRAFYGVCSGVGALITAVAQNRFLSVGLCVLAFSNTAFSVEETFTTAGPRDCSAVLYCQQNTADGLFTLNYEPTYPPSGPSRKGFKVRQPAVEISNANGGPLDLSIMQISLIGSNAYNGVNFIGAVQLEVEDDLGNWTYLTQWSSYIGASGIYVIFNGASPGSPLVKGVRAVRLTGVNGTTAFNIGMMNLTAH